MDSTIQVKLPDDCMIMAGEMPLKCVMGIVEIDPVVQSELEHHFGGRTCDRVIFDQPLGDDEATALAEHAMELAHGASPPEEPSSPPGFPVISPLMRRVAAATNLVNSFIQLRYHIAGRVLDRSEDDRELNEEWKNGGDSAMTLTAPEKKLYNVCLRRLTAYVASDTDDDLVG